MVFWWQQPHASAVSATFPRNQFAAHKSIYLFIAIYMTAQLTTVRMPDQIEPEITSDSWTTIRYCWSQNNPRTILLTTQNTIPGHLIVWDHSDWSMALSIPKSTTSHPHIHSHSQNNLYSQHLFLLVWLNNVHLTMGEIVPKKYWSIRLYKMPCSV